MNSPPPAIGAWKIWQKLAVLAVALAAPAVALVIFDVTDATGGSEAMPANVRLFVAAAVGLAELALAGLLVWIISRGYARQADALLTTFERLAAGDGTARAAVVTGDEFGVVAAALNVTLDRQPAALGRTPNHGTPPGPEALQRTASTLVSGAAQHQEQVHRAADCAREIRDAANRGARAAQTAAGEIGRVREQVQAAAQSVRRLRDGLHDVERAVQSLGDLADQTSLAALNTTIQVTSAGDAGHCLKPASGEVERLAERSTETVQKIAALVQSMSAEVGSAAAALGGPAADDTGRLAAEAVQALADIGSAAVGLMDASGRAATSPRQLARSTEALARSLGQFDQFGRQAAAAANEPAANATVRDSERDPINGAPALPARPA
ncbi:MAG: methyl-accepting chemotaxis protein [Gemmataceae bacterium]